MVNSLKLQTSMHEVQPGRTIDIHSCAQHFLGERFRGSEIGRAHCEVRDGELHMERHVDRVGDEKVQDAGG